jgi:LPS export ABC transporter protein LptC
MQMAFFISMKQSFFFLLLFTLACSQKELKEPIEYEGPLSEAEDVELDYSENEKVKVKMKAALIYEYENGDREFPKGIFLEFFDEFENLESTLRANEAFYFKAENKWRGRGNVEVKNIKKKEQLNTEELFWMPKEEKIFTEKFLTIRQEDQVLSGEGLDAKQDLSLYKIKKPIGEFDMQE